MRSNTHRNEPVLARLAALHPSIATLLAAHRYRDPFTHSHQEKTAALAVEIANRIGLTESRIEMLRLAALVHDIGKIGIPAEIIGKPGSLSDSEYALIKEHCKIGHDIISQLHAPFPLAEIAFQHHERLDGSGYPRALAGSEILAEARILAVADVFQAMSSNRAYRPGIPQDVVLRELRAMAGVTLDADAVEACHDYVLTGSVTRGTARRNSSAA